MPQNSTNTTENRLAALLAEQHQGLPIWVRAPAKGGERFTGLSRAKLYELAGKGRIRTCCLKEPHMQRGTRLFNLPSILAYIEQQEAQTEGGQ